VATAVDAALVEVNAAVDVLTPDQVGINEFEDIPLTDTTKHAVDVLKTEIDERMGLLKAAVVALEALIADGYPVVPTETVPPEITGELQADLDALIAVRKLFIASGPPVAGRVTFAAPTP
jgi:hypothetical protein